MKAAEKGAVMILTFFQNRIVHEFLDKDWDEILRPKK
jgi:hypothetical protein